MGALPPGSVLSDDEARRRVASGLWSEVSLAGYLEDAVARYPDRVAAISIDPDGDVVREMTYAEVDELSRRVAAGLQARGIGQRDAVSVMMTNCAEFLAIVFGVLRAGATYSGIPITYGRHEIEYMTTQAGSKALIVSRAYGGKDVLETSVPEELRDGAMDVIVVGEPATGTVGLDDVLRPAEDWVPAPIDPFGIAQLAFTSGTTSSPKAVMNLHATLDAMVRGWAEHIGHDAYGTPLVNLVMSPVGHSTGFFWGSLLTVYLGGTAVYAERWSPEVGVRVIDEYGITFMIGAPTFYIDLIRTAGMTRDRAHALELVVLAGAPIPRPLMRETEEALDCVAVPAWGMTEFGIAVSGRPGAGEVNYGTDGVPLASAEVSIRDESGAERSVGEEGDLWLRGSGLFVGYAGRPDATAEAFDADGWFATGDTAVRGEGGTVSITGRTKDIIIRGGENIPVGTVESMIFKHPSVTEVAVVGYPDERLGERACAFLRCRPGESLDVESLLEFLVSSGLAKRYCPERVLVVDELPKTMSGKIRKVELRDRLLDAR
ncbi:AMP-binding protein [Tsukamurella sp. PLM1]|uniref:AMP-binding protein n=1 Tax=Tsukamurella sp. PLM1 TaxID=2929795 RepID=UPI00205AE8A3|nr:AMP-binding protein [Tsukamurella sp. PLM1]BDH56553.1 cyclohexanecarboxylate-CoA ligase [Tsukamurella sp. PLM1]